MEFSIINYYGKQASRCGYCKGTKCSIAHGMHAYTMSPQDYQELIDRGWRRSGQYCYKPHNQSTCCPCYTIKCDALEFKLSKSHKKILKRMTRFLRDGKKESSEINDKKSGGDSKTNAENESDIQNEPKAPDVPIPTVDLEAVSAANPERNNAAKKLNKNLNESLNSSSSCEASSSHKLAKKLNCDIPNPLNPPCKKAKQMRLERRQAKLIAKGLSETDFVPVKTPQPEKTLADFIAETSPNDKHKLKIVLVSSSSLKVEPHVHSLYRKYQLTVHNDKPDRLTPTSLERFLFKTPLKLNLVQVRSKEFSTTLPKSYKLYEKYQQHIHNDPPEGLDDFMSFLGHSPLKYQTPHDGPPQGYGSFHQQYWLDDKLIAVAVIDILPHCLSSVYFFYDPDYSFLSLGTYASLREIEFVQQLAKIIPALKYYYMGFYIHSCPKMRYKGKLVPSELLCSEAYTWHLLTDEIRQKLDERKYQRFNPDINAKDIDEFVEDDLDQVLILLENNICASYGEYIQSFRIKMLDKMLDVLRSRIYNKITGENNERDLIIEYGKFVGKANAHRILYLNV